MNAWISSGRINEVKNKEKCTSGIKKVVVGRINGVVALTGCFYKKMYERFAGPKKSGRNNEVVVLYEAREGAVYRDKSRDAVDVRKQIHELKKQHNQNKNSQKVADKSLANITVQTKRLQTWLEKQRGPFGKKFQAAYRQNELETPSLSQWGIGW